MISNGSEADIVGNCSDDLQVFVKAFSSLKRITCFGISEYCSRIATEKSADPWLETCFSAWQALVTQS